MTKRGGAFILCKILTPPQCLPLPDATILIYLNGRHYLLLGFVPPMPPPSPDATILNNLKNREGALLCL